MSTKYPQGVITATPPFQSTTAQSFSGVWTLEQLGKNYFYYQQPVAKSLRFRSSASAYLNRTPSTGGNRTTWTWSAWVKRGTLGSRQELFCQGNQTSTYPSTIIEFVAGDNISISAFDGSTQFSLVTSAVYRDPSSWYHIVIAADTTQAASSDRLKLYVNGTQVTAFGTASYPALNYNTGVNATVAANIGRDTTAVLYLDGYLAEFNLIDGQALDPSYFGQLSAITGVWSPKKYVGSYGGNGFYLPFTDATSTTTLGYDSSGNSNNWTTNNISLTSGSTYDSMWDSPTSYDNGVNGVGNYAVLNPVAAPGLTAPSNGNLQIVSTAAESGAWPVTMATASPLYFEVQVVSGNPQIGLQGVNGTNPLAYNSWDGNLYSYGSLLANVGVVSSNDLFGIAIFGASNAFQMYKNGSSVYSGTIVATNSIPYVYDVGSGGAINCVLNFGQRPFAYTPPTGFKALNTQNLPAVSIANGANHMAATTYTGNGGTQSVINAANSVSFQPDFVWIKSRGTTDNHQLQDSVRGATKRLFSNLTDAESADATSLTAFNSNGFALGNSTNYNGSTYSFIAWNWKAGGTAVTNTAGSITSQVSANPTAGFSVVTYTGTGSAATTGHGLGVAPNMIFVKRRDSADTWNVYHSSLGANQWLELNTTAASQTATGVWNNTAPTSNVFSLGFYFSVNASGSTYVAYCFAAIPGYSAFGSYTGNGSSDGPFVYCGFRPRWVLIKLTGSISGYGDWRLLDSSRNVYNVTNSSLSPDTSDAENTTSAFNMDFLSNGFKLRTTYNDINANGYSYIYAAFAENPFKYSLAR